MTKVLQQLLSSDEPLFSSALAQLEKSTGHEGIDLRLIADITHKAHDIMRSINLDPADTTARELYLALNAYAAKAGDYTIFIDADYVLLRLEDEVVSFNIIDIIENAHHELGFEARTSSHGQRALRGEIAQRYFAHPGAHEITTQRLLVDAGVAGEQHDPYIKPVIVTKSQEGPYILAIGDIFTDAFIKLGDETAKIIKEKDGVEWLAVPFGRKPPYETVDIVKSVGPSPNVAVAISRLGYRAGLMAWIGDDETGKEAIAHLEEEGVDTGSMITEAGKLTSYWYVLRYMADRTMLVKSEKYAYEWHDPEVTPDWVYLSYLGEDSWPLHVGLLKYLEAHPECKLVFQPGTFQFKWGKERLADIYRRSHIVLMNREEAVDVTGKSYDSLRDLANGLHELGPHIVVITDGPNGSYASYDGKLVTIPNYPDPAPPVERTGAGDAFSSTFVGAVANGETIETALSWAPINSMNVVQKVGAQAGLLSRDEILQYLGNAPNDYKVTEIED